MNAQGFLILITLFGVSIYDFYLLKKSKVKGSLINHSEHRISSKEIEKLVLKLKELKMISIVCVKDVAEVKKYLKIKKSAIFINIGGISNITYISKTGRLTAFDTGPGMCLLDDYVKIHD